MAIIKCSECGREISDRASACPSCGNPTAEARSTVIQLDSAPKKRRKYKILILLFTPIWIIGSFGVLGTLINSNEQTFAPWFLGACIGFIGMAIGVIGNWLAKP